MTFSEEHVTRAMARKLVEEGWEIVAVHPPDGQGPFVIPKPPLLRAIERSSYHPDIVALRQKRGDETRLMLVECKLNEGDLVDDLHKLSILSSSRQSLLFALFRCQLFVNGPGIAVDFDTVSQLSTNKLPIVFAVAAMGVSNSVTKLPKIGGFECSKYLFEGNELSR